MEALNITLDAAFSRVERDRIGQELLFIMTAVLLITGETPGPDFAVDRVTLTKLRDGETLHTTAVVDGVEAGTLSCRRVSTCCLDHDDTFMTSQLSFGVAYEVSTQWSDAAKAGISRLREAAAADLAAVKGGAK